MMVKKNVSIISLIIGGTTCLLHSQVNSLTLSSLIRNTNNPILKADLLRSLLTKKDLESLRIKLELLDCTENVGREGDTVSEVILDELQRELLVEYEFDGIKRYLNDENYRNSIIKLYKEYIKINDRLMFSAKKKIYYNKKLDRSLYEKHMIWYGAIVLKR